MRTQTQTLSLQGGMIALGALLVSGLAGWARRPAADQPVAAPPTLLGEVRTVSDSLEVIRGELAVARLQLQRADAVMEYSGRYGISADVSAAIYDLALAEGVDPALAFRLVKTESNFSAGATSRAGAIGYTQILPSTARLFEPGLTTKQLYRPSTNLRLGFRYLRDLLERYDGDLGLALLAYNRGPAKVQELLDAGRDPQNGYSTEVMKGYRRKG